MQDDVQPLFQKLKNALYHKFKNHYFFAMVIYSYHSEILLGDT